MKLNNDLQFKNVCCKCGKEFSYLPPQPQHSNDMCNSCRPKTSFNITTNKIKYMYSNNSKVVK